MDKLPTSVRFTVKGDAVSDEAGIWYPRVTSQLGNNAPDQWTYLKPCKLKQDAQALADEIARSEVARFKAVAESALAQMEREDSLIKR